ncbi:MAG: PAS domain-containing sensor histidine kinase [Clostridiaceae bacterium]
MKKHYQRKIEEYEKKAERDLEENHRFYRNIFELSGVGIVKVTLDGKFSMVNETFCKITGYSEEELKEKTFVDITYFDDIDSDLNYVEELLLGKINSFNMEKRYVRKDGTVVWINLIVSLVYEKDKKTKYFLGVVNDISKNKKNELELTKQSQALLYSPLSIVITDKKGLIEYVNPAFESISGFKKDEVIGKNPRVQGTGEHTKKYYGNVWNTILQGKTWKGMFKNKKKSGDVYWEEAAISPIVNSKNEITHFVAIKEDISKRKRIQEDLIKSKKEAEKANKVKSAFIANISHEIRTPLNSILGFSNLLLNDEKLTVDQKSKLKVINRTGEHLLKIINEILEISKLEAGKISVDFQRVNLYTLLEDIKDIFYLKANEKKLKFRIIFGKNLPKNIITDELKLKQILINLIGNALKFTDDGSVLVFAEVEKINDSNFLGILIEDTGTGIEEENLEKIFEYFTQIYDEKYSKGGTGLGLSIVKEFIELLGGKIEVRSKKLEGSQFKISIPIEIASEQLEDKEIEKSENENQADKPQDKDMLISINKEAKEELIEAVTDGDLKKINDIICEENISNSVELDMIRKFSKEFKFKKILELLQYEQE